MGVSSSILFYRDLLANLGVEGQAVRVGKYKSFPESFQRMDPSEELQEVREVLTGGMYREVARGIAESRGRKRDEVEAWMENGPYVAEEAKELGLIDGLTHTDQVKGFIERKVGGSIHIKSRYRPVTGRAEEWGERDAIAVVAVNGAIVGGKSGNVPLMGYQTGSMTLSKSLRELGKDPGVKGIVLRIDSPGGSALASDQLNRLIRRISKEACGGLDGRCSRLWWVFHCGGCERNLCGRNDHNRVDWNFCNQIFVWRPVPLAGSESSDLEAWEERGHLRGVSTVDGGAGSPD